MEPEDKNKQSYYMVIPAEVWGSTLSAKSIVLYGHISVLANKHKFCWASNSYFEQVMGISKTVLTKCMGELEDLGFIERKLIYHENSKQVKERRIYLCVTPGLKIGNRA